MNELSVFAQLRQIVKTDEHLQKAYPRLKKLFLCTMLLSIPNEIFLVLRILPVKWVIDCIVAGSLRSAIPYILAESLAIAAGSLAFQHLMGIFRNRFREYLRQVVWGEAHAKELDLSNDWHDKYGTGEKEALIGKNSIRVLYLVESFLMEVTPTTYRIIFSALFLLTFGWQYGTYQITMLVVYGVALYTLDKKMQPLRIAYHKDNKYLEKRGTELTIMVREIKNNGLEKEMSQRNRDDLVKYEEREDVRHLKWRSYILLLDVIVVASGIGVFYLIFLLNGDIPKNDVGKLVGILGAMFPLFDRVHSNLFRFTDFMHHVQFGYEALKELVVIFATVPTVRQPDVPIWPKELKGKVEFRNVSLRYPGKEEYALKNINLVIQPGESVAFVGATGSGKSTLMSLLSLSYLPTAGEILVDDIPLTRIDIDRFRQEGIGIISQQTRLFDDTVRNNIRIGADKRQPKGLEEWAAKLADAHTFIMEELADGYDTMLGGEGQNLSGGQRQRITIARALFKKPPILIMDEATSALDESSQRSVKKAMDYLIKLYKHTKLIVAHRLSTIDGVDRVVVMEKGEIIEQGTHDELLKLGGIYAHYRNLQSGNAAYA